MNIIDHQMLIDGNWVDASGGATIASINPYTTEPWATVPRANDADVIQAIDAASNAFRGTEWRSMSASARGRLLVRFADLVFEHAEELSIIESTDNGKLITEMSGQLNYIPEWFRYFGGLADKVEGSVIPIDKPKVLNYTRREPLGVVTVITPWNSPLLLATWKLAPALAAGNTIVWKPSEFSSVSALAFAKLFERAGFPPGVVNVITGYGSEIGRTLVTHPLVAKVAFTGGDATGQSVYESAATGIKPVLLELGGKSANIIFDDAEFDNAIKGVVSGIFAATGQTCIAGSRALVQRTIYDQFVEKLVKFASTARMGDPLDRATQVGPVTTEMQLEKILNYIEIAKTEGAQLALGGKRSTREECGRGWFVEPTIFTQVSSDMRIAQEEVFGPVLSVIPFDDEDEAIEIANSTVYGLAAGVWTKSIRRAINVADRLEAGTVWVNTYRAVSYMSPFGGYKRSGIGRESGINAINEYLHVKSIWIDTSDETPDPFVLR